MFEYEVNPIINAFFSKDLRESDISYSGTKSPQHNISAVID